MGDLRTCDLCKNPDRLNGIAVRRYGLRLQAAGTRIPATRNTRYPGYDGEREGRRYRFAGSIDMCDRCWDNISGPRTYEAQGIVRRRRAPAAT